MKRLLELKEEQESRKKSREEMREEWKQEMKKEWQAQKEELKDRFRMSGELHVDQHHTREWVDEAFPLLFDCDDDDRYLWAIERMKVAFWCDELQLRHIKRCEFAFEGTYNGKKIDVRLHPWNNLNRQKIHHPRDADQINSIRVEFHDGTMDRVDFFFLCKQFATMLDDLLGWGADSTDVRICYSLL